MPSFNMGIRNQEHKPIAIFKDFQGSTDKFQDFPGLATMNDQIPGHLRFSRTYMNPNIGSYNL